MVESRLNREDMPEEGWMEANVSLGEALLDALARRDFAAIEATLDPAVQFRALAPGESVTVGSARDAIACLRRWFGDKEDIEYLDRHALMVVDRLRLGFRARVWKGGQPHLVQQALCGDVEGGRFATLDLLCTGFRPEAAAPTGSTTHVFDAGDLGCGTGLPREFRTRINQIPLGHVLEVITTDAAAREDLPSLARLLGHLVQSIEPGPDNRLRIRVERLT
jgi:TusA-related sulfurtransferase